MSAEDLFDKLNIYSESDFYPYHMPGHKRQPAGKFSRVITGMDITEIDGFDNLHQPEGILLEAQRKAARLYGAEESFFLINGSTCGVLSAISAAVSVGGRLLMARNSHRSAYHAAYLRRLQLSFLYPQQDLFAIPEAVTPKQIRINLEKERPGAVFIVSPTYEGRIADIATIAGIVHEYGIPLIVDEAHGAHLGFAEGFAKNSCRLGADIVVNSVHKTLPALTQTALLHVNGSLVDRERLKRFLRIYQSSSPSYLLMASIDQAMSLIERDGQSRFTLFQERYTRMCSNLKKCTNLVFPGADFLDVSPGKESELKRQDIGKLIISGDKCGVTGQFLYDSFRDRFHLQLEMAAPDYCLAMFTVADPEEAYARMEEACFALDRELGKMPDAGRTVIPARERQRENQSYTRTGHDAEELALYTAWDMETEEIPLASAQGRYAGDFITPYPPGVPFLIPGERFTSEDVRIIRQYISEGLQVQGVDKTGDLSDNRYVRVIADKSAKK